MSATPPYGGPYPPSPPPGPAGDPPLWLPHYGCSLPTAVVRFLKKYATFRGRASRAEYWWAYLATVVVWFGLVIAAVIAGIPGSSTSVDGTWEPGPGYIPFSVVMVVFLFGVMVPSIAVAVRRLHDANLSGWFFLLMLVPYVGGLVVLVLTLLPPKPDGARFDR